MSTRCQPLLLAVILAVGPLAPAAEPNAVTMVEDFGGKTVVRTEVKSTLTGKISIPDGKGTKAVTLSGAHTFEYDERPLPDEGGEKRLVRTYRTFDFARTIAGEEQKADVRKEVRRMVVLRSDAGRKAPFSPDGPLTFGEIDAVRNDLFAPVLVAGLLPPKAVTPAAKWRASDAAVLELTDLDKVDEGEVIVEFVGVVKVSDRKHAKLSIGGSVKGANEEGPSRQTLDGVAYFDLERNLLTYLKLNGTHELIGPDGKPAGKIEGTFTVSRDPSPKADDLSEATLKGVGLKPTDDNTLLLYDNPDLGVKFLHPRRWRVGVVQGRQLILEEPRGGWAKLTVLPPAKTPTAAAFRDEVKEFLAKEKVKVSPIPEAKRWQEKPAVDRFGIDVEAEVGKVRAEYAVLAAADGGVTVDWRMPDKAAAELTPDLDRVLKSLSVTKKIAEK